MWSTAISEVQEIWLKLIWLNLLNALKKLLRTVNSVNSWKGSKWSDWKQCGHKQIGQDNNSN